MLDSQIPLYCVFEKEQFVQVDMWCCNMRLLSHYAFHFDHINQKTSIALFGCICGFPLRSWESPVWSCDSSETTRSFISASTQFSIPKMSPLIQKCLCWLYYLYKGKRLIKWLGISLFHWPGDQCTNCVFSVKIFFDYVCHTIVSL